MKDSEIYLLKIRPMATQKDMLSNYGRLVALEAKIELLIIMYHPLLADETLDLMSSFKETFTSELETLKTELGL